MTRVLLADDQALVRTGFRMILDSADDMQVVGEADDGEQAVTMALELRPDVVVLMDIRMPDVDGVEATRRICADDAVGDTHVLILTTFDLDEYVYTALRAGASGFLLKDTLAADLLSAIRVVARGDAVVAPSITRRLLERYVGTSPAPVRSRPTFTGSCPSSTCVTACRPSSTRTRADWSEPAPPARHDRRGHRPHRGNPSSSSSRVAGDTAGYRKPCARLS